jgi:hypothetical protein
MDQTVGCTTAGGVLCGRYRLGHRSVMRWQSQAWLNVQSGQSKLLNYELCLCDQGD